MSCWSNVVVTGEDNELGSSGHSGRNLPTVARAASDAAAVPSDMNGSARLTAVPPRRRQRLGRARGGSDRGHGRAAATQEQRPAECRGENEAENERLGGKPAEPENDDLAPDDPGGA